MNKSKKTKKDKKENKRIRLEFHQLESLFIMTWKQVEYWRNKKYI